MSNAASTPRGKARNKWSKKANIGGTGAVPSEEDKDRHSNGQFKDGNGANLLGRRRGPLRNWNEEFLKALEAAWTKSGAATIEQAMAKYPDLSLMAAASLVSKHLRHEAKPFIEEDAVLAARKIAALAELKKSAGADETPSEPKGPSEAECNRLALYRPYKKQIEFHNAGAQHDERLLMAGNQLGKTLAGAMEWAMHLTGRYPDWWKGKVFDAPVRLWSAGVTAESTRDNPQRVLMGVPQRKETWGTGAIPKDALKEWRLAYHMGDALDSVVVRWGGGGDVQQGESVLSFKSYEKGREKWQGETLDGVWFDEEPPLDIYCEGRTRTVARRGIVMVTFTPLQGMTELVKLFLSEADVMKMQSKPASP
jgi:phage terminase large subunit-like protein